MTSGCFDTQVKNRLYREYTLFYTVANQVTV